MRNSFTKFISVLTGAVYLVVALAPLNFAHADGKKLGESISHLIEAHRFVRIHPSKVADAGRLVKASNELLRNSKHIKNLKGSDLENLKALKKLNDKLESAAEISKKLASSECSNSKLVGRFSLGVVLRESERTGCQSIAGHKKKTLALIQQLASNVQVVTNRLSLNSFINDIAGETMSEMFKNYWKYKGELQERIPTNFSKALNDIFGTKWKDDALPSELAASGFISKAWRHFEKLRDEQHRKHSLSIKKNRENRVKNIQAAFTRIHERKKLGSGYAPVATGINKPFGFTNVVVLPDNADEIIHEGFKAIDTLEELNTFHGSSFDGTKSIQSARKHIGDRRYSALTSLIKKAFIALNGPEGGEASFTAFEHFPPDRRKRLVKNYMFDSHNLFSGDSMSPEVEFKYRVEKPQPILPQFIEFNGGSFKDNPAVYVDEFAKEPLLFTRIFRTGISVMSGKKAETPVIDTDQLDRALKQQQTQIKRQMKELRAMIHTRKPKETLKTLVESDPARVWKYLADPHYSHLVDEVCQAYASVQKDKKDRKFWDKVYLWGGLGLTAIALASGVGGIALMALAARTAATTLVQVSIVTGLVGAGVNVIGGVRDAQLASKANKNYQILYARIVAGLARTHPGTARELHLRALKEIEDRDSLLMSAVIAGVMSGVDAATSLGSIKTLRALRDQKRLLAKKLERTSEGIADDSTLRLGDEPQRMTTISLSTDATSRTGGGSTLFGRKASTSTRLVTDSSGQVSLFDESGFLNAFRNSSPSRQSTLNLGVGSRGSSLGDFESSFLRPGTGLRPGASAPDLPVIVQTPRGSIEVHFRPAEAGDFLGRGFSMATFKHADNPQQVVKLFRADGGYADWGITLRTRERLDGLGFKHLSRVPGELRDGSGRVIGYVEEALTPGHRIKFRYRNRHTINLRAQVSKLRQHGVDLEIKPSNIGFRKDGKAVMFDVDDMSDMLAQTLRRDGIHVETGKALRGGKPNALKAGNRVNVIRKGSTTPEEYGRIIDYKYAERSGRFNPNTLKQMKKYWDEGHIIILRPNGEPIIMGEKLAESMTRQPFFQITRPKTPNPVTRPKRKLLGR